MRAPKNQNRIPPAYFVDFDGTIAIMGGEESQEEYPLVIRNYPLSREEEVMQIGMVERIHEDIRIRLQGYVGDQKPNVRVNIQIGD